MDIRIFDGQLRLTGICDRILSLTVREEFAGEGFCTLRVPLSEGGKFSVDSILHFPGTEQEYVIRAVERDSVSGICRVDGSGLLSLFGRRILREPVTASGEAEEILCSLAETWGAAVLPGVLRTERAGISAEVSAATGHDSLLTAMKRICASAGVGMSLRLDADGRAFVFSVRSRRMTSRILSRSAGTLQGLTEKRDFTRYRSRAIVIGVGDRTAVVEAAGLFDDGVNDGEMPVREIFEDASDLALGRFDGEEAYQAALQARGKQILAQHRPSCSLTAETAEESARVLQVGDVCFVSDEALGITSSALCTARTLSGDGAHPVYAVTVQVLETE